MIRRKRQSWEVRVYAGRDPVTGRERYVSRSVPAKPGQTKPPRAVTDLESLLKVQVRQGHHGGTDARVRDLLGAWLAQTERDLSPWTVNGYRGIIDRYLNPNLGDLAVRRLTPAKIERLYDDLRTSGGRNGTGLAPLTVRHAHAVLRRALWWARRRGWIDTNPADGVELAKLSRATVGAVSDADLARLLAHATDPDLRLLVLLADGTGARRGELCGLRWGDVDLKNKALAIRRSITDPHGDIAVKPPKSGRERSVAIGATLVRELKSRRARVEADAAFLGATVTDDWYVLGDREPLRPERATGRFRVLARTAGVPRRLHDLRHGHVTNLLAAGVSVPDVSSRVGHSSARMTLDVYGHAIPAGDRAAAKIAERRHRP